MSSDSLRRQEIINEFKTVYRLAERIVELEAQLEAQQQPVIQSQQAADDKGCQFPPEYHPVYGYVTHMRYLGRMKEYDLEACVVCGTVQARPVAIIAGASPTKAEG